MTLQPPRWRDSSPGPPCTPQGHTAEDNHFHVEWEWHQWQEAALDILPGRHLSCYLPTCSTMQVTHAKQADMSCRFAQSLGEVWVIFPELSLCSTIPATWKWNFFKESKSICSPFSYPWSFSSKNSKPDDSHRCKVQSSWMDSVCLSLSQAVAGLSGATILRGSCSTKTRQSWWFLHPACYHPVLQSPCTWSSGGARSWRTRKSSASMCLPPWNSGLKSGGTSLLSPPNSSQCFLLNDAVYRDQSPSAEQQKLMETGL